jgi:hypothetical protein
MTVPRMPTDLPHWLTTDVTVLAKWDGRGESAADVARRFAAWVTGIDAVLPDSGEWRTYEESPVAIDVAALTTLVEAGVERDAFGDAWPTSGYSFGLVRRSPYGGLSVSALAGSSTAGRRLPSNSATVRVSAELSARAGVAAIDGLLASTISAWEPDTATARDSAAALVGNGPAWSPIAGQRSWISARTGSIGRGTDDVAVSALAAGTLLSADDRLPSDEAAKAVRAVLDEHGVTSVPRTPVP